MAQRFQGNKSKRFSSPKNRSARKIQRFGELIDWAIDLRGMCFCPSA